MRTNGEHLVCAGILAVLAAALVLVLACAGTAAGATWVVDDDGGADFTSIQAAVDAAGEGDTIEVRSGTYVENVDIATAHLTLIGEGADVVTVWAEDAEDPVFEVTADYVNISGFTVTGATDPSVSRIHIDNADCCNVYRSNIYENFYDIHLGSSGSNTLTNNIANSNYCGIYISRSGNNDLIDNTASNNGKFGIGLSFSSNNNITNNIISNNTNYGYGIVLGSSSNNNLTNNIISSNYYDGILLSTSSNYNILTENTARSNDHYGIYIVSSSNNTLYHNNLVNNTNHNAYDDGTNAWDSGSVGNYYSDYTGTDSDGDGIGDTHHLIPGGGTSVDHFPLMQPWAGDTAQKGDLNSDGILIPADAAIALEIAVGSRPFDAAADVSGDNHVTSLDALMILQAAAGVISL